MHQTKRSILAFAIAAAVVLPSASAVYAHGHGGSHHGGGSVVSAPAAPSYYYCNGHNAHTHANGICPYVTSSSSNASGTSYYTCNGHVSHTHADGVCPYGNASVKTVKKLQRKLNRSGYYCGTADGILGTKTRKALRKFQKANDLQSSGTVTDNTLKLLGLA